MIAIADEASKRAHAPDVGCISLIKRRREIVHDSELLYEATKHVEAVKLSRNHIGTASKSLKATRASRQLSHNLVQPPPWDHGLISTEETLSPDNGMHLETRAVARCLSYMHCEHKWC